MAIQLAVLAPAGRARIVALARGWIGTPYHHQASLKGIGTDCLGLVRGVWREVYGAEPADIPPYSLDWAEAQGAETLLEGAREHMDEIDPAAAGPGDVLVFRLRPRSLVKHAAILTRTSPDAAGHPLEGALIVHAAEGVAVCEVPLASWWRRRIAAAFAFPGMAG
jgi:NlpC/P60 family putative phage cell wall peptidase